MKAFDLARLAAKSLRARGVVLPFLGFAIGAFCLCIAGTALMTVQTEKGKPFELMVSSQGNTAFSDAMMAKLSELSGVRAVTPVFHVAAKVKTRSYTAELTLTGIDGDYLGAFWQGGVFPQDSAMPYIVLNKAACRQFDNDSSSAAAADGQDGNTIDAQDGAQAPLPSIDWLSAPFIVQAGGPRPVVSRICGILAGDDAEQEPAAYISLAMAQTLLHEGGQNPAVTAARVRVANIGVANDVSQAIAALGLAVEETNADQQAIWDVKVEQASFLLVTGAFALLCAVVVLAIQRRSLLLEQRDAWAMLRWMGMRGSALGWVFALRGALVAFAGAALGVTVALCLPAFLAQGTQGSSIFLLQTGIGVAFTAIGACVLVGMLSFVRRSSVDVLCC